MHSLCVFTTTDEELDPMHKFYLKIRLEVLILLCMLMRITKDNPATKTALRSC